MSDHKEDKGDKEDVGKSLTPEQRQAFDDASVAAQSHADSSSGFDGSNPDHRLYSVSFDGSWKTDQDAHLSNSAKLEPLVEQGMHPSVKSYYLPGVGTQGGSIDKYITGGALGEGSVQNVDTAYENFKKQVHAWQKENPNAEIHLSATGFSRGSAAARDFVNELYHEGVPAEGATRIVTDEIIGYTGQGGRASEPVYKVVYSDYAIAPGEIKVDSMLLYDTVDTGQETHLDQEIPPIPGMRVLHLTAGHEFRDQFNGVSIIDPDNPNDPRLLEISLPGDHGDLGGGHGDNGIESLSLQIGHDFLRASGVPIADIPAEWLPADGEYVIHDSLKLPYTDFDGERDYDFFSNPPVDGDGLVQPVLDMDLSIDGTGMPIQPFTDTGEVNIDYILSLDTSENRQAFLESKANPEFAGILTIEEMQAQQDAAYYGYLKEQAIDRIVLDTGIDAAEILDLDVPGNPNAPGYYPEIPNTVLSDLLASDNDAQNAGFAGFGASQQEADNPGSTGWQADNPWGTANGNAPWSPEEEAWHQNLSDNLEVGYSAYELYRAIEHGDFAEQLSAGFDMVQDVDQALNGTVPEGATAQYEGLNKLADSSTAVGVVAFVSLADAIDDGDVVQAASSAVSLVSALNSGALGAAAGPLAYIGAFVQLGQGNYEGAAISAASTYLMGFGPWGWAAAAVLQIVGGDLMAPDDPLATLSFGRGEDGTLDFDTFSNETGEGLETHMNDGLGAGLVSVLAGLESSYAHVLAGGRIDADALPALTLSMELGDDEVEWRLEGGRNMEGAVQNLGLDPSPEDISRALRDVTLISHMQPHWKIGEGTLIDPVTGETMTQVFFVPGGQSVGGSYSSEAEGTGVFAGGGNVGGHPGVTVAKDADIKSLAEPRLPPAAVQLAAVKRTWNVERGLFAGEEGKLLAIAVGAGLISLDTVANASEPLIVQSVFEHDRTSDFLDGLEQVIVAGRGVVGLPGAGGDSASGDEVILPGGAAGGDVPAPEWLRLYPGAPIDHAPVDADKPPFVVTSAAAGDGADTRGAADPFAEARDLAEDIRDFAATQNGQTPEPILIDDPVPASPGDGGQGPIHQREFLGESTDPTRPAVPVGHVTTVAEDRFLVTDAARLLAGEGEGARLLEIGSPRHGVVETRANGDIHFTPDPDYAGEAGFGYRIETADGAIVERQAVIAVTPVNDRPGALDDDGAAALTGAEDQAIDLSALLANDTDVDGDALRVAAVGQVSHGSIGGDADSGFTFTPDRHYHGEVDLVYVLEDAAGARSVARAQLVIAEGPNDAPEVAYAVVGQGVEERPVTLFEAELLARVADPEGDAVTLEGVRAAAGGRVAWDPAAGTVTFTPEQNFFGTATLELDVADANGNTGTGSVGVEVAGTPDPLSAGTTAVTVTGDAVTPISEADLLAALAIDTPDGGQLDIVGARMVEGESGRVNRLPSGDIEWIGAPGHTGASAFEVRVSNGGERTVARVEVTVTDPVPGTTTSASTAWADDAGNDSSGQPVSDPSGDPTRRSSSPTSTHTSTTKASTSTTSTPDTDTTPGVNLPGVEDNVLVFQARDLLPAPGPGAVVHAVTLEDPATGTLAHDAASGEVAYTPAADFFGPAVVAYSASDGGETVDGRATLVIANVDDAPVVENRDAKTPHFNLDEDQVAVFTPGALLGETVDADGETLALTGARMHDDGLGRVEVTAEGRLKFTPAADYHGDAAFDIDVSDGNSTVAATMTVRLWPVNDAPRGTDDHASTQEETALRVSAETLLANDSDIDGSSESAPGTAADLRLVGVWAGAGGAAHFDAAAGEVVFTPADDFHGTAWIDTLVEDGDGAWSVSRLHVDVANTHDPVEARDDIVHIAEDADPLVPLDAFTANDHNPDGGPLTLTALNTGGVDGVDVVMEGGGIRLAPEAHYNGTNTFTYTVTDAAGAQSTASVTLVVDPVNDAPVVDPMTIDGTEDTPLTFSVDDLLANAHDVEGDWLQVGGIASADGDLIFDPATGQVAFTPARHLNSELNGGPLTVDYRVVDEGNAVGDGVLWLDLAAVDDPPEAVDDVLLAWEAGPGGYTNAVPAGWLLANDVEHDGEALRVNAVSDPDQDGSTISVDEDGDGAASVIHYTAADGFTGRDRWTYTVADESGNTDTAEVAVQVLDNQPLKARDFATTAPEDTILVFGPEDFAGHVTDPDHELAEMPETVTVVEVSNAVNGTVHLTADGQVVFDPDDHYNSVEAGGVAGFDYVVEDIVGHRSPASASLVYTPVNDAPIGVPEHLGRIDEDSAGLIFTAGQLLANDVDIEGDELTVTAAAAGNGTIQAVDADTYQFVPGSHFNGTAPIHYTVSDGELQTLVTSRVTVNAVNDRPIVEFDRADGFDNGVGNTATGLLANDFDVDGDALHIAAITGTSANVHVSATGNGSIQWQAASPGSGYITYNVSDGNGGVTESRLDLVIAHKAVPPVYVGHGQSSYEGNHDVSVHVQDYDNNQTFYLNVNISGGVNFWDPDDPDANIEYIANEDNAEFNWSNGFVYHAQIPLTKADFAPGITTTQTFSTDMTISATDEEGNFTQMDIPLTYTAHIQVDIQSRPIVLDLNEDGFHLAGVEQSESDFDWTGDGRPDNGGWIAGRGDGLLAYDHDGDRQVTQTNEIAFVDYLDGAQTDLEGLAAFDSDGDGQLSANDDQWAAFGVWADDGDGVFEDGEFQALASAGIESLSLQSNHEEVVVDGNVIHGEALFTRGDGSEGRLADVSFAWAPGEEAANGEEAALSGETTLAGAVGMASNDDVDIGEDAQNGETESTGPLLTDQASGDEESSDKAFGDTKSADQESSPTDSTAAGDRVESTAGKTAAQAAQAGAEWMPSNDELDRMAQSDVDRLAAQSPKERVAPLTEASTEPTPAVEFEDPEETIAA